MSEHDKPITISVLSGLDWKFSTGDVEPSVYSMKCDPPLTFRVTRHNTMGLESEIGEAKRAFLKAVKAGNMDEAHRHIMRLHELASKHNTILNFSAQQKTVHMPTAEEVGANLDFKLDKWDEIDTREL